MISLILSAMVSGAFGMNATVMSLNLHGYHPMDEQRRLRQASDGSMKVTDSYLFYFTQDEIRRGLETRQAQLAQDIELMAPDLVFFQEVGGGSPDQDKTCADFERNNTALDLKNRLKGYDLRVGCRGNLGWWTDTNSFNDSQIWSEDSRQVIFKKGDNPYPKGMIIEGLAILSSPRVQILDHQAAHLNFPSQRGDFFVHWVKFNLKNDPSRRWYIAMNVHGGHKVEHFEQAVTARAELTRYIFNQGDSDLFGGIIVGGDFNALTPDLEVSTTPWSYAPPNETRESLKQSLMALNGNKDYKPFATLDSNDASFRIDKALEVFEAWKNSSRKTGDSSLYDVFQGRNCRFAWSKLNPKCRWKEKIDHFFVSDTIRTRQASGFYSQDNWTDLKGTLSDHPGIWVDLSF